MTNAELEKLVVEKTLKAIGKTKEKKSKEVINGCAEMLEKFCKIIEEDEAKLIGTGAIDMISFFSACKRHMPDDYKKLTDEQKLFIGIQALGMHASKLVDTVRALQQQVLKTIQPSLIKPPTA